LEKERDKINNRGNKVMTRRRILVERTYGGKSYYDFDILEESPDGKTLMIKVWNGIERLIFDDKKKCYKVQERISNSD